MLGQKISEGSPDARPAKGATTQSLPQPRWTGPTPRDQDRGARELTDWRKPIYVKVGATRTYSTSRWRSRRAADVLADGGRPAARQEVFHRARRDPDQGRDPEASLLQIWDAPRGGSAILRRIRSGADLDKGWRRRRRIIGVAAVVRSAKTLPSSRATRGDGRSAGSTTTGTETDRSDLRPDPSWRAASTPSSAAAGWRTTARDVLEPRHGRAPLGQSHSTNLEPRHGGADGEAAAMSKVRWPESWVPGRDRGRRCVTRDRPLAQEEVWRRICRACAPPSRRVRADRARV